MSSVSPHTWAARVRHVEGRRARVYVRHSQFDVDGQASLRDQDDCPSALEFLLGAFGADLVEGFVALLTRAGFVVDAAEISLAGSLNNVLSHLGVVGETGHAGLETISGTLYASVDAEDADVRAIWPRVLERSPLYQTLRRSSRVEIDLMLT